MLGKSEHRKTSIYIIYLLLFSFWDGVVQEQANLFQGNKGTCSTLEGPQYNVKTIYGFPKIRI